VSLSQGRVERIPTAKLGEGRTVAPLSWGGVESLHFAALLVPMSPNAMLKVRPVDVPGVREEQSEKEPLVLVDLGTSPGPVLAYVGPKDYQQLQKVGHDLAQVVDVGRWLGPIVVPLMSLLQGVHARVGNYGWSIVLVTLLINLVMAPFRHYTIANSLKMAKMAPEMKVIQERYRKIPLMDPRRQDMQQEMGALYARHGLSMSSQLTVGCLPTLLTMPFLFAFYTVLTVSIELRGASFLWIPDLSQKDPFFITPVLMGLSLFAMQRMTPSTLDPAQQKIMMLMPLMLSGMLLWAPAGLNLYWLASNLASMVQQWLTYRILKREPAPVPKEKRRR
jgi:YidC/Oxa1 family membrane protein insertase